MRKCVLTVRAYAAVILLATIMLPAQNAVAQRHYTGLLQYQFPYLTQYPPLNTGMPYDVLMAYIIGDSISRHSYRQLIDNYVNTMGYSDTLKEAARFVYEANDYNPVLFYQWSNSAPPPRPYMGYGGQGGTVPGTIRHELCNQISRVFPDSGRTASIINADYIADVSISSTEEGIDSGAVGAKHHVKVTCTVLDPIKGQVLPVCTSNLKTEGIKKNNGETLSATGGCLQFEYALEWSRFGGIVPMPDSTSLGDTATSRRWVQPDSEYIVFLSFVMTELQDTVHGKMYCTLFPGTTHNGKNSGIYPVINGYVYDPYNDFGFGTGLTVAQFKAALRNKIYSITHP